MVKQTLAICLLLPILMDNGQCETYPEFVKRHLEDACPYSNYCYQNATAIPSKSQATCCLPCTCDKECAIAGNCCPDYTGNDDTVPNVSCLAIMEQNAIETSPTLNGINNGINFYLTVVGCPFEYPDQLTDTTCTSTPRELVDAVRVSDRHGRVYRNRHCAICNGITDYTTWELRLTYGDKRPFQRKDLKTMNATSLLENNFGLLSIPPKQHIGLLHQCYQPEYHTCNQTGHWAVFDEKLDKACRSYSYAFGVLFHQTSLYKNPFCYLCNENEQTRTLGVCKSFTPDIIARSDFKAFTAIINLPNQALTNAAGEGRHGCQEDEIHDPYLGLCKPLRCPIGTFAMNGRCINLYREISGLTMAFQIVFNISRNADNINNGNLEITKLLYDDWDAFGKVLIKKIGLSALGCVHCAIELLTNLVEPISGSRFLSLAEFSATKKCALSNMYDAMINNVDGQSFHAPLGNVNATITAALVYPLRTFTDKTRIAHDKWFVHVNNQYCSSPVLVADPKFYCPHLELSQEEYQLYRSGALIGCPASHKDFAAVAQLDEQEKDKTHIYKICIKDYIKQDELNNSAGIRPQSGRCVQMLLIAFHTGITFVMT